MHIIVKTEAPPEKTIGVEGFSLDVIPGGARVTTQYGPQDVVLSGLFAPYSVKIGMVDYLGRLVYFDFEEWYGQKDFASFIKTHYAISDATPAFFLYFDATADESVMICYRPVVTSALYTLSDQPCRSPEDIARFYPVGAKLIEAKRVAKTKALRVNLLDSVVALEQQVDVLTRLVLVMAEDMPTKPSWYQTFKDAIAAGSVENLMPAQAIIGAFSAHKNMVRGVQVEYFSKRDVPLAPTK